MDFPKRLKMLREKKKINQSELAGLLNLSASTIGMYERGKRSPCRNTLKEIAAIFNVSVDFLIGLTDYPDPIDEASSKIKDLEHFLKQPSIFFKGRILSERDKQRISDVLTTLFF